MAFTNEDNNEQTIEQENRIQLFADIKNIREEKNKEMSRSTRRRFDRNIKDAIKSYYVYLGRTKLK